MVIIVLYDDGSKEIIHNSGNHNFYGFPHYGLFNFSQSGMIYTANELLQQTINDDQCIKISSLSFMFEGWKNNYTIYNQSIELSHIKEDKFTGSKINKPDLLEYDITDTTTVWSTEQVIMNDSASWVEYIFTQPFYWNGTDNLLITWKNNDGNYVTFGYGYIKGDNSSEYVNFPDYLDPTTWYSRSMLWYSDDNLEDVVSQFFRGRPNIKLSYEIVDKSTYAE